MRDMVQAISNEAIERGTGKPWEHWREYLDDIGASEMSHKEIARQLHGRGGVDGWWSQMLTVAYEQHIGRRVPGQGCDGEFSVSVTKTISGDIDGALSWWLEAVDGMEAFSEIPVSIGPDVRQTEKWRYWRAGMADGSRVTVHIHQKTAGKAGLAIMHEKLESTEQLEHWRAWWKQFLVEAGQQATVFG